MIAFDNLSQLSAALAAGRTLFCGAGQSAFFLQSDGSVLSLGGCMVAPPSAERAALWAAFAGWNNYSLPVAGAFLGGVRSGGNVEIDAYGRMTAPTSPLDALTVALTAVAAEAPAVEGLENGVRYFNTTDHKLYILTEGAWAEDAAPAAGKIYHTSEAIYKYDDTNYMTLL